MKNRIKRFAKTVPALVAQTAKSAVSRVSKPAGRPPCRARSNSPRAADLEIGDTAGLETCATGAQPAPAHVAQTSKSAVSRVSQPAGRALCGARSNSPHAADLEIGDTAGLETGATGAMRGRGLARWVFAVWLGLGCLVSAQEKRPPTAAVEGIKGVKEDAVAKVKNIETGNATPSGGVTTGTKNTAQGVKEDAAAKIKNIETGNTAPGGGVATGTKSTAQGVNKIDGIDTINGVKADGRTAVLPPPPPPPPPPTAPPVVPIKGTAVNVGGGTVGASGSIRSITGVAGINTVKLQNLEAALQLKHAEGKPEPGGKAAAAALLAPGPPGPKSGPKADGRAGFQEFEKLPNIGS